MTNKNTKWDMPLLYVLCAAVTARVVIFVLYHKDFWYQTYLIDDCLFYSWAHEIASGDILGLSRGVFRMNPGYPYTLAAIIKLFGSYQFVPHIVQYLAGAATCGLIYILTKRLFGGVTAVIAGIIAALYGMSIFYEGKLLGSVWILFFNALMLVFLTQYESKKKPVFVFLSGLCLGFSMLYLPTVGFFIPFVFGWLFIFKAGVVNFVKSAIIFLGGVFLVLAPVAVRNLAVDKKFGFVLTTSSGGVNFFIGNNAESNGYNAWPSFIRYSPEAMHDDFKTQAQKRSGIKLSDSEVSSYWFKESLKWIKAEPGRALKLFYRKAVYFWNAVEPPDNFMMDSVKKFTRVFGVPLISWGALAPFAIAGLILLLMSGKTRGLIIGFYTISYFFVNMLFYILSRYRFPAAIGIIILAAFCLTVIYESLRDKKYKKAAVIVCSVLVLFLFTHKKVVEGEVEWSKHYSIGVVYMNTGRIDDAIEEYRKSIALNPEFASSRINLGNLYLKKTEYALAVENYLEAAKYSPGDRAEIYRIVGEIYFHHLNDFEKSVDYLNSSVELNNQQASLALADIYQAKSMPAKSLNIYMALYDKMKTDPVFLYKIGLSYYHNRQLKNAAGMFKEALLLKPDYTDAQNALAYIKKQGE